MGRFLFYLLATGICFAIGRYVFPASQSLLNGLTNAGAKEMQAYWQQQLALAQQERDSVAATHKLSQIVAQIQPAEFPIVWPNSRADSLAAPLVAAQWSDTDPNGAFTWLASQGIKTPEDQILANLLLYHWATRDPKAATAAASRLRRPDSASETHLPVALALLRKDVAEGVEYLSKQQVSLPIETLKRELSITNLNATNWSQKSLPERIAWLRDLPASPSLDFILTEAYTAWAEKDAGGLFVDAETGTLPFPALQRIADTWWQKDPAAAQAFLQKAPAGLSRTALQCAKIRHLAATDAQSAWDMAQWTLEAAPRGEMLTFIIMTEMRTNPAQAAKRITEASEAPWRSQALSPFFSKWHQIDPLAAQAWYEQLSAADQTLANPAQK